MSTAREEQLDMQRQLQRVCAELERRVRAGEACTAEDCLRVHPALAADGDCVLELVYFEYVLREELGQAPNCDSWYQRFPEHCSALERLFQIHRSSVPEANVASSVSTRSTVPPTGISGTVEFPVEDLQQLEDYQILEELGRGSMGVVYRARQIALQRDVAVKMILAGAHAGPEQLVRFRREAQAVARLQHPNIVQVFEIGEDDGRPFLAMEYVNGHSLDRLISRWHEQGRLGLTPQAAAQLTETLARAVHYAHQQGVVHRDLKPANVLVSGGVVSGEWPITAQEILGENGAALHSPLTTHQIKITDFGLAKFLDSVDAATLTGNLLGTPCYMSPEQAASQTHRVGPHSDVYALGVILYELLTGQPPFRAPSVHETLSLVRDADAPPPRQLQPNLPRDLQTICMKCLEKEPAKRFASAEALADDLRRFLAHEPIRARSTTPLERTLKWIKRRPLVTSLITALVLITTVSFGVVFWQWQLAVEEREHAQAESARHLIALAHQAWLYGDVARARQLLDECPFIYRDEEWQYLHKASHAEVGAFQGSAGTVAHLTFSSDGGFLARRGITGGSIQVYDVAGRHIKHLGGLSGPARLVVFPPGSRKLLALNDAKFSLIKSTADPQQIAIWSLDSGDMLTLQEDPSLRTAVLNAQGDLIALESKIGTMAIQEVASRKTVKLLTAPPTHTQQLLFTSDGKQLMSVHRHDTSWTLAMWDLATGTTLHQITTKSRVEPSPNGRFCAALTWQPGFTRNGLTLLDLGTGTERTLAFEPTKFPTLKFSPDERFLALQGNSFDAQQSNQVLIWNVAQNAPVISYAEQVRLGTMTFSHDGRWFATVSEDRVIKLWDTTAAKQTMTFRGHKDMITDLAFSPQGSLLASTSRDGETKLWSLTSWQSPDSE